MFIIYTIYMHRNLVNDMIYIGQTRKTIEERALNGTNYKSNQLFTDDIKKYGWDNFSHEILKDGIETQEEADFWETQYIACYDATNPDVGYNIESGGHHSMMESTKQKISALAIERYKDKTKNPMYGKKHSEETIVKMRNKKLGENNPMYGKHLSAESKEKLSKALKGRKLSELTEAGKEALRKSSRANSMKWAKKVICVEDNIVFDCIADAAKAYVVSTSCIHDCCYGKQKTSKGKHFKFYNSNNKV